MEEITIDHLQTIAKNRTDVIITQHTLYRFRERGITINDILNAIMYGKIIEQYPNDYPYPSCLVLGVSVNNNYIHVVCGSKGTKIWIVTAYYPTPDKWEKDFITRKVVK